MILEHPALQGSKPELQMTDIRRPESEFSSQISDLVERRLSVEQLPEEEEFPPVSSRSNTGTISHHNSSNTSTNNHHNSSSSIINTNAKTEHVGGISSTKVGVFIGDLKTYV